MKHSKPEKRYKNEGIIMQNFDYQTPTRLIFGKR